MMHASGLHQTGDSPRERAERHRARKIGTDRWLREVNNALSVCLRDLTADERKAVDRELRDPGSELQKLFTQAYDRRWPAYDFAGRVYFTMYARRRPLKEQTLLSQPEQHRDAGSNA